MPVKLGLRIPDEMRRLPLAEVVSFAAEAGVQALDLPRFSPDAVRFCRDHGIAIGSVDAADTGRLLSPDDAIREQAVKELLRQIEAMAANAVNVLFLCLVPDDDLQTIARSLELFKDSFPIIAANCEATGVRIALEGWPGSPPYFHTLGYTPEVWRAMFDAVPSTALGLCFDPSHLVRLGIDYMRVLDEFKARIVHCHGKDTALLSEAQYLYGHLAPALDVAPEFSDGSWRYCIPGTGAVNWASVAFALEQAGYDGCVSIELEDARYCGSPEQERQGVRKALQHLAQHFT